MILDVRELLVRLRRGESVRAIARDLGVARKTIRRYRAIAEHEGLLSGDLPSTARLDACVRSHRGPSPLKQPVFRAAPHREVIESLMNRGVEAKVIHQRLCESHDYTGSYSSVYRFCRSLRPTEPCAGFVRIETSPGEEAQVDFGTAGTMIDRETGEMKKAWLFVMTLSMSRHQYTTFVFNQRVATWLRCHREAFEFFGGVPERVVIDNLKAAIVKATFHDPGVQRSYREFAEHYGFSIAPCRVRTPRHKGKVESGVRYVERNFLRGRETMFLDEANTKVLNWVERIAGRRTHGTTQRHPLDVFDQVERAALHPLPVDAYDLGVWKRAKLHPDCHVVLDKAYYSAPHRLIGQRLWIRSNEREVVIYHDHVRLATHRWAPPGGRRTMRDHYPPDKAMYLMATPMWCREKAEQIGPSTARVVDRLFGERPLDRLRSVQSIVGLATRYAPERVDAACRRALYYDDVRYATIKRILAKGLEGEPLAGAMDLVDAQILLPYTFARRGSEIFQ